MQLVLFFGLQLKTCFAKPCLCLDWLFFFARHIYIYVSFACTWECFVFICWNWIVFLVHFGYLLCTCLQIYFSRSNMFMCCCSILDSVALWHVALFTFLICRSQIEWDRSGCLLLACSMDCKRLFCFVVLFALAWCHELLSLNIYCRNWCSHIAHFVDGCVFVSVVVFYCVALHSFI